jgi:hypothetical protein
VLNVKESNKSSYQSKPHPMLHHKRDNVYNKFQNSILRYLVRCSLFKILATVHHGAGLSATEERVLFSISRNITYELTENGYYSP